MTRSTARASGAAPFNSDHYSAAMSVGGGLGACAGFASCVSHGLALGHLVAGALIGALVGPALVAVGHVWTAMSYASAAGAQLQSDRRALGETRAQADALLERAAGLRTEVVAALMAPAALDAAALRLRHIVDATRSSAG